MQKITDDIFVSIAYFALPIFDSLWKEALIRFSFQGKVNFIILYNAVIFWMSGFLRDLFRL